MFDDAREVLPDESRDQAENSARYKLREHVATIINQRMTRVHTSSWADSLRFLIFDDGHDHEPQQTNQEPPIFGQCQPCQEQLPLPAGHVCEKHLSLTPTASLHRMRESSLGFTASPATPRYCKSASGILFGKGHSKPDGETVRLATTHIMFKMIESLVSKGEKELADSILNSTSNRYWNSRSDLDDMIESVDEFPPGLQAENRAGMFVLDPTPDGGYHQSWIIDRVMEQGAIRARIIQELEKRFTNHKHSKMLIISSMLSRMGEEVAKQVMPENPGMKNSLMEHSAAGSIMALYMAKDGIQGPEMGRRRATFDVDVGMGEAFVLTPFQMVLESLPRPAIRGMSVSWVVEGTDSRFDVPNTAHEEKERCFKVKGMARRTWRFILLSPGRYTLV
ncbi:hypothetical protein MRS44_003473 [Fusarium solani]|uniref:uncharacterized protein n=1 Tax=Fusarium solani TaxID=169388 RepID=UPI0032C49283|nr:hypothetical protein MRS44_003473 [Fusarium solani]